MTVSTFYASTTDGIIQSSNGVYATAAAGSALTAVDTGNDRPIGQEESGGNFFVYQGFFNFVTSAIDDTDLILDEPILSFHGLAGFDFDNACTLEARGYNWGTTLATSAWRTPVQYNALDLKASIASGSWNSAAYNDLTPSGTFAAYISLIGATRLMLCTNRFGAGSAPGGGQGEKFRVYMADQAGTTNDPKLVVTHSAPVEDAENLAVNVTEAEFTDQTQTDTDNAAANVTESESVLETEDKADSENLAANVTEAESLSVLVDDPDSNLIWNSGFEVNLDDWGQVGGSTLTRTTAEAHSGSASASLVTGPSTSAGVGESVAHAVTPGLQYRGTLWMKGPAAKAMRLRLVNGAGSALATTNLVFTGSWQQESVVATADANGFMFMQLLRLDGLTTAFEFFVDDGWISAGDPLAVNITEAESVDKDTVLDAENLAVNITEAEGVDQLHTDTDSLAINVTETEDIEFIPEWFGFGVRVDVYDRSGARVGGGPVTHVMEGEYAWGIDQLGTFQLKIPADSLQSVYFDHGYEVRLYFRGEGLVFRGIVEKFAWQPGESGMFLTIIGSSLGRELVWANTMLGLAFEGATLADTVGDDATAATLLYNTDWGPGELDTPAHTILARFDGVSIWQALMKTAEICGFHVREDFLNREVDIVDTGEDDSGLAFRKMGVVPLEPGSVLPIETFTADAESEDLWNSLQPLGAGEGNNKLDLRWTTRPVQLLTNSSFETTSAGWTADLGILTRTSAIPPKHGLLTARLRNSGTGPYTAVFHDEALTGATAGRIFSSRMYLYGQGTAIGKTVALRLRGLGGASPDETTSDTRSIIAGWQILEIQHTMVADDRTTIRALLEVTSSTLNEDVWFDAVTMDEVALDLLPPHPIQETGPDGQLQYLIEHPTSIAAYGRRRKVVSVKEAAPLANSTSGFELAANALYDAAWHELRDHRKPFRAYSTGVLGLKHINPTTDLPTFKVGQNVRVQYRGFTTEEIETRRVWLDVDEDLKIMRAKRMWNQDGENRWEFEVTNICRHPEDAQAVAHLFEDMHALKVATRPYTYREIHSISRSSIQGSPVKTATLNAFFDDNVQIFLQNKLSFRGLALRSNVTTVANSGGVTPTTTTDPGSAPVSAAGGASAPVSAAGGSSSPTSSFDGATTPTSSSTGAHRHRLWRMEGTQFSDSVNNTNPPSVASTQGRSASHTHPETGGTTGVESVDHTHSLNNHTHQQTTRRVYAWHESLGVELPLYVSMDTASLTDPHTRDASIDHTHTVSIGTHQHTVSIGTHTHTVTIGTHQHTVTIPGHSHQVTIAAHNHSLQYGIYDDPSAPGGDVLNLEINGVDATTDLGGPWPLNTIHTVDVSSYLVDIDGQPLRQNNTFEFGISSGLADVEATLRSLVTATSLIPV